MKRICTLTAIILMACTLLQAQNFRFGFELTPTVSWLGSDDNEITPAGVNVGGKIGFLGEYYFSPNKDNYAGVAGVGLSFGQGGKLTHEFGGNFWPSSELSTDTATLNYTALPDGVTLGYSMQYLEIPFGFKMRTNEIAGFRYFAQIPMVSLAIKTQARGSISGDGNVNTKAENINPDVFPLYLAWGFGGGAEYYISDETAIVGGLFFNSGFTDITTNKGFDNRGQKEDSRTTLKTISLRLGVIF